MFNIFKKKPKEIPTFENLKNSEIRDSYLVRLARWDWLNRDSIQVIDNNSPGVTTMDPWPQLVYLGATEQKAISDFTYEMAGKYGRNQDIPENLDLTILETIESLQREIYERKYSYKLD